MPLEKVDLYVLIWNLNFYVTTWELQGLFKSSKPYPEIRVIAEHFCYGNELPLLIKLEKLIQISVLISVQVRPIQKWEIYDKSKIWVRLRTFLTTLIYSIIWQLDVDKYRYGLTHGVMSLRLTHDVMSLRWPYTHLTHLCWVGEKFNNLVPRILPPGSTYSLL